MTITETNSSKNQQFVFIFLDCSSQNGSCRIQYPSSPSKEEYELECIFTSYLKEIIPHQYVFVLPQTALTCPKGEGGRSVK